MQYFVSHADLQLIYENHQILLDSFYLIRIDGIQHQTNKQKEYHTSNIIGHISLKKSYTLLLTSSNDNIIKPNKTIK